MRQYFLGRKPALRAKNETVSTPGGRGRREKREEGRDRREEGRDRREEGRGRREEGDRRREEEEGRREMGGGRTRERGGRRQEGCGHCYRKAELSSWRPPRKGAAQGLQAPDSLKPPDTV